MINILFPTDFSPHARNALRYLAPIAVRMSAQVFLLHVYEADGTWEEEPAELAAEERAIVEAEMRAWLCEDIRWIRVNHPGVVVSGVLRSGETLPVIKRYAGEMHADWIMMGTRGGGWRRQLQGGSLASRLASEANCPVLIIPGNDSFHGLSRIVFATNYQPSDLQALRRLLALARPFGAEIQIVHISPTHEPAAPEAFRRFREQVVQQLPYPYLSFRLLLSRDVSKGLVKLVNSPEVELLAMSPRKMPSWKRWLVGSRTQFISHQSCKAVLTLPEE
ncbi:MAG: universal stress protein [Bacteroidia bacterium]